MDLNNITMQSIGPVVIVLLAVAGVFIAIASVIEEANKGRKQKQRDREWDDLSKP